MYQINKEVLEATIQYLSTQPYAQVSKLIQVLQTLQASQPIVEDKPKE